MVTLMSFQAAFQHRSEWADCACHPSLGFFRHAEYQWKLRSLSQQLWLMPMVLRQRDDGECVGTERVKTSESDWKTITEVSQGQFGLVKESGVQLKGTLFYTKTWHSQNWMRNNQILAHIFFSFFFTRAYCKCLCSCLRSLHAHLRHKMQKISFMSIFKY